MTKILLDTTDLETLGFIKKKMWEKPLFFRDWKTEKTCIMYKDWAFYLDTFAYCTEFFPESIEDIKTVIRIFSK